MGGPRVLRVWEGSVEEIAGLGIIWARISLPGGRKNLIIAAKNEFFKNFMDAGCGVPYNQFS